MKTAESLILGLAIAMGSWECSAQQTGIPFRQIEKDTQFSATPSIPEDDTGKDSYSRSLDAGRLLVESSAGRAYPTRAERPLSASFFLLNGLHLGMAAVDVGLTQRCINDHKCREGNPLVPGSMAGKVGLNLSIVAYGSYASYRMRKHQSTVWWLTPAIGVASHAVGIATGIAHQ